MRFTATLAAGMAMFSFALAQDTITQTVESTTTLTLTMTNYNATTTMYYATGTGNAHQTTAATTYSKPQLPTTASPTPTDYPGAASMHQANLAVAGVMGLAAVAFAL